MRGNPSHDGIIAIAGPTASGKSAVAASLAHACAAEVVNLDPYQAFAGLEILTAQPDGTERELVPHHLYGFLPPGAERDAAGFAVLVRQTVEEVRSRGHKVVLVSGSGLYLRAFSGGIDDSLPASDPALRTRLEALPLARQLDELHALDPEEWERIDRRNPRRVIRALEICLLTGGTASALRKSRDKPPAGPQSFCLWPESEALKVRIQTRARAMLSTALAREIDALRERSLGRSASSTLGLETVRAWRDGHLSTESAIAELATRTWQYARRQRTWFKKAGEFELVHLAPEEPAEQVAERIRRMAGW